MKRIEFIAPVEAMRGNLSGKQEGLQYPAADNKAYESPLGSVNYAKNYRPSFIGAKRAKDGMKYFTVKTKTAIHLTAKSKRQMALLGGGGACFAAIMNNETQKAHVELAYLYAKNLGETAKTLREFLMGKIIKSLGRRRNVLFTLPYNVIGDEVTISNPWIEYGDMDTRCSVSGDVLDRFFTELGPVGTFKASLVAGDEELHFYAVAGKKCEETYVSTGTPFQYVFDSDGVGAGQIFVSGDVLVARIFPNLSNVNVTLEGEDVSGTDQIVAGATYAVAE